MNYLFLPYNKPKIVIIQNWLKQQKIITKIFFSFIFAGLTGLSAQMKIYLPWTPIPITLQTIMVLYSGILLGSKFGCLTQVLYLLFGVLGIPWTAGNKTGFSLIFGPTCGYLIGFIFASYFIGQIFEQNIDIKMSTKKIIFYLLFSNFLVIYFLGMIYLYSWNYFVLGIKITILDLLFQGFIPFVVGDLFKICLLYLSLENIYR